MPADDPTTPTSKERAEARLAKLEEIYDNRLAGVGGIESYSVGGRMVSHMPLADLRKEINRAREDVSSFSCPTGLVRHRTW